MDLHRRDAARGQLGGGEAVEQHADVGDVVHVTAEVDVRRADRIAAHELRLRQVVREACGVIGDAGAVGERKIAGKAGLRERHQLLSSFQIFLREEYPIYLLMTGLYENIYDLQNEKSLTFLYRAPKIILEPLNYTAIKSHYMRIFDINDEMADKMTLLTRGYPFAFQVLGYLYWDNRKDHTLEDIMPEYDQYLDEYVYSKIWAELSSKDKEILSVISESGYQSVKDIREKLDMKPELFSVYRDRLKRKGVIDTRQYGKIAMALPRFEEYVKNRLY